MRSPEPFVSAAALDGGGERREPSLAGLKAILLSRASVLSRLIGEDRIAPLKPAGITLCRTGSRVVPVEADASKFEGGEDHARSGACNALLTLVGVIPAVHLKPSTHPAFCRTQPYPHDVNKPGIPGRAAAGG